MLTQQHLTRLMASIHTYISSQQHPEGCFLSTTSSRTTPNHTHITTFYTSLITCALSGSDSTRDICTRATHFLKQECSPNGSWNYWSRKSDDYTKALYPDDLDDTTVALRALYPHLPNEETLLALINLLIANETEPGGPYYTWIGVDHTSTQWNDIDIVVNSNIYTLLQKYAIDAPALYSWLEERILRSDFSSKYYTPTSVLYFLSLWYKGNAAATLCETLLSYQTADGHWGKPLHTACAVCALIRFGYAPQKLDRALTYLATCVTENKYPPDGFFIEKITGELIFESGACAFTAAVIYEACSLLITSTEADPAMPHPILHEIFEQTLKHSKSFGPLSFALEQFVASINAKDTAHEIFLTPWYARGTHDPHILVILGVANMLGWVGYTICDRIMDTGESLSSLPIAELCIHDIAILFSKLLPQHLYLAHIQPILRRISVATYTEYTQHRITIHSTLLEIPENLTPYSTLTLLAEKSIGHAVGPIILSLLEGDIETAQIREEYFTNYLIARQLNDDAHDWESDIANGIATSVVTDLLYLWQNRYSDSVDLSNKTALQELFWDECIDGIVASIMHHTSKARELLWQCKFTTEGTLFFEERICALEKAAEQTRSERDKTRRFLQLYTAL